MGRIRISKNCRVIDDVMEKENKKVEVVVFLLHHCRFEANRTVDT